MYKKVDTNMNFVDREHEVEKFWNDNDIFLKSMESRKREKHTLFMMDLQQQMVNHILDMF